MIRAICVPFHVMTGICHAEHREALSAMRDKSSEVKSDFLAHVPRLIDATDLAAEAMLGLILNKKPTSGFLFHGIGSMSQLRGHSIYTRHSIFMSPNLAIMPDDESSRSIVDAFNCISRSLRTSSTSAYSGVATVYFTEELSYAMDKALERSVKEWYRHHEDDVQVWKDASELKRMGKKYKRFSDNGLLQIPSEGTELVLDESMADQLSTSNLKQAIDAATDRSIKVHMSEKTAERLYLSDNPLFHIMK